ncbi:MAG: heme o synthase [Ignavibacteria bacterium]|nr:heme o synthase [Ignavibacteria bacterium]
MSSRIDHGALVMERSRVADFISLTKPELTFLSVLTALGGAFLGMNDLASGTMVLLHVMIGTLLVGGGAGALNQYIERHFDRLMKRTENRPIPAGRVSAIEALVFGVTLSLAGLIYLMLSTNFLTTALAFATLTSYLFVYTPLKRQTWVSTLIGGVPGALPPVMGWTAMTGAVSVEAMVLFGILFFWQMPHFFSLAWMYRTDYERAGYPMLTVLDPEGKRTSRQILGHLCGLILAAGFLAPVAGLGPVYFFGALILGVLFFWCGLTLSQSRSNASARRVFFASLAYLPFLLALVVLDRLVAF